MMMEGINLSSHFCTCCPMKEQERVTTRCALGSYNRHKQLAGIVTDWPCSANVIASATRAELMTGLSILATAQAKSVSNQIKFTHLKNCCFLLQRSCNSTHAYFQSDHHKDFSQSGIFYQVRRKNQRKYEQINPLVFFSDFSQVCFLLNILYFESFAFYWICTTSLV